MYGMTIRVEKPPLLEKGSLDGGWKEGERLNWI
jgi:hypothetical protein